MSPGRLVDLHLDGRAVELVEGGRPAERVLRLGLLAHLAESDDLAAESAKRADQHLADGRDLLADADLAAIDDDGASSTHSSRAAIVRSFAWTSRQASRTELPISTDDRLADVCWSYGTTAVSPMTTVTQSSWGAELLGGDLGEDRPGALAHVGGAGVDDRRCHRRAGGPSSRTGRSSVRTSADRDPATATRCGRAPPPDHLGRAADRDGPVPVGRGVAGDERVAPGGRGSAAAARAGRCPRARAASSMFDSTAQICLGVPEAAERRGRGRVRQDRCGRAIRTAGIAIRPARGVAPLPDRPVGDVGVGADEVVRGDVAEGERPVRVGTRSARGPPPRRGGTAWKVSSSVRTSRTGRSAARRAMNATSGSYLACCLPPNAPPGSGAKTRTFESGRYRSPAMTRWSQFGCWIELQTAMPSPSGAAMKPCGSIANWVTIGNVYVPSTMTIAPSAPRRRRPSRSGARAGRSSRPGIGGPQRRVLDERRGRVERGGDGDDRRNSSCSTRTSRGGLLGGVGRLGRDRRDRLSVVVRLADREDRSVLVLRPEARALAAAGRRPSSPAGRRGLAGRRSCRSSRSARGRQSSVTSFAWSIPGRWMSPT